MPSILSSRKDPFITLYSYEWILNIVAKRESYRRKQVYGVDTHFSTYRLNKF